MKKSFLITQLVILFASTAQAQYLQNFETTSLTTLVNDSGWLTSGVTIGSNNKLTGAKELQTQILNTATSSSTFLTTYFYKGIGLNQLQFQHVIDNSSGKDISLTITALDSVNSVIGTPFSYSYANANARFDSWTFYYTGRYKLHFEWSGAKVRSGSSAFLDMIFVSSPFIPLPVKLVDFTSEAHESGTEIKWTVAEELNLSHYDLFKSIDGNVFTKIAEIKSKSSESLINDYKFLDQNSSANAFYKVKMVDLDGSFAWSKILKVKGTLTLSSEIKLYPIPADNCLFVEYNNDDLSNSSIIITDAFGKTVLNEAITSINDGQVLKLDISSLQSGVYFVNINNSDVITAPVKFIKF